MKTSSIVENQKRKIKTRRNLKKLIRNSLLYLIYYPIISPFEKISKHIKKKRDLKWMNNKSKLKKAMLKEIAIYVTSYIVRADERKKGFEMFLIYNLYEDDETNYGNSMHLRSFIEFNFYTNHKNHKSKLYHESKKIKYKDNWSEDKFYNGLMKYIEKEFKSVFKSEIIRLEVESKWGRNYEYILIKRQPY